MPLERRFLIQKQKNHRNNTYNKKSSPIGFFFEFFSYRFWKTRNTENGKSRNYHEYQNEEDILHGCHNVPIRNSVNF